MIGAKANQDWFLTTHDPRFVSRVSAVRFKPSVYFTTVASAKGQPRTPEYVDVDFPILNEHRTMFWIYRRMNFMVASGLPLPRRIDFSYYLDPGAGAFSDVLQRALDDADATLLSLGAVKSYGAVETYYFLDAGMREGIGRAFAASAAQNSRMHRVTFRTTQCWIPGWMLLIRLRRFLSTAKIPGKFGA